MSQSAAGWAVLLLLLKLSEWAREDGWRAGQLIIPKCSCPLHNWWIRPILFLLPAEFTCVLSTDRDARPYFYMAYFIMGIFSKFKSLCWGEWQIKVQLSPVFTEKLFKLLPCVVSFKVCFCHGLWISFSLSSLHPDWHQGYRDILLDVDREKTAPEASLQQSLHLPWWALTYIQHIRLKSTQPLSVALPSQEGSRWREAGGGKEEGVWWRDLIWCICKPGNLLFTTFTISLG